VAEKQADAAMSPELHRKLSTSAQALTLAAWVYFLAFAEVVRRGRDDSLLLWFWRRLEAAGLPFWQAAGLSAAALAFALLVCVAIPRLLFAQLVPWTCPACGAAVHGGCRADVYRCSHCGIQTTETSER
jgi:hypothetical protein